MSEEKILTINLRKSILKKPKWKRSSSAVRELKKILRRRLRTDKILLDKLVNEKIWSKGGKKPPTKLKLKVSKEEGFAKVSLA